MAEPEDLILDGAHIASRVARAAWRRYAPASPDHLLRLADVRVRIELFLTALFERPLAVVAADGAAPGSWLARLAGRGSDERGGILAGTDGVRIYLPPTVDASGGVADAVQWYLLIAVEQAARLVRGSAAVTLAIVDGEVRDRFLLADAVAVDDWIVRQAPGLTPALRTARQSALAQRTRVRHRPGRSQPIEARLREFLAQDPRERFAAVPMCVTPSGALEWACTVSGGDCSEGASRGLPPVVYWGRPLPLHNGIDGGPFVAADDGPQIIPRRRVAEMRRRPRVREAGEDEDDQGAGMWILRPDEPQETVEDPFGLQRPADRADEADPEGLGDSLAELPEARVVRTPGQAREILRAGDDLPTAAGHAAAALASPGLAYAEWDYRSGAYRRPGAIVRERAPALGDLVWVKASLDRHAALLRRVRSRFERLRPRRLRVGRQRDGAELDIDEYVNALAALHAGVLFEDRLYAHVRRGRRELTVALLVDVSASTDSWVSGRQRIVDVEKDALLLVCEALRALGDRHAIFAFCGEGAEHVAIIPVKSFGDSPGDLVRRRIAALDADGYTRVGAAIRHATAALSGEPTERRLLLILSDGKPNDVDEYEGTYGIEDARQAVAEARAQGVDVFCLTVDRDAPRYARRIFGRTGFGVLRRADLLPEVLIDVLRRLLRP
jgi:nitric oxide reductase NorD protein